MIPRTEIAPRLAAQLEPDETVLWQGAPRAGTFFGAPQVALAAFLVLLGVAILTGFLDAAIPALGAATGAARYVPVAAIFLTAALTTHRDWTRRGSEWSYAITDRRLLSILGGRVVRSMPPALLDLTKLEIAGDTVFWARSPHKSTDHSAPDWMRRGPDYPLVGFHGQDDPEGLRRRILDWRRGFTDTAAERAADFLAGDRIGENRDADAQDLAPSSDARHAPPGAYVHRPSGVSLDIPEGWRVTTRLRTDKPFRLLGVTILPKVVKETEAVPYGTSATWNVLRAEGAPDTHLELHVREGRLDRSLQEVLDDKWAAVTGLRPVDTTPDLSLPGGYRGYAVGRIMPGPNVSGAGGEASKDTLLHQAWLSNGRFVLEVQGVSPSGHPVLGTVIERMIQSIGG